MKYRKKTGVVEAVVYQPALGNERMFNWLAQQGAMIQGWTFYKVEIVMPDGSKVVDGDYIVKDESGAFLAYKPREFEKIYAEAGAESPDRYDRLRVAAKKLADRAGGIAFTIGAGGGLSNDQLVAQDKALTEVRAILKEFDGEKPDFQDVHRT